MPLSLYVHSFSKWQNGYHKLLQAFHSLLVNWFPFNQTRQLIPDVKDPVFFFSNCHRLPVLQTKPATWHTVAGASFESWHAFSLPYLSIPLLYRSRSILDTLTSRSVRTSSSYRMRYCRSPDSRVAWRLVSSQNGNLLQRPTLPHAAGQRGYKTYIYEPYARDDESWHDTTCAEESRFRKSWRLKRIFII